MPQKIFIFFDRGINYNQKQKNKKITFENKMQIIFYGDFVSF